MQRAGSGRRGAAALVDMGLAFALLLGLAAAGFQLTGGRVDLDPFLLPLFVLLRWAFDRFAGAPPGRRPARIRVAEAESAGARVGVALGRDLDLSRWAQHRCEAEFFVGEWHLIRGEADAARGALRDALKDCPAGALEAHAAEDELLGRAGFK